MKGLERTYSSHFHDRSHYGHIHQDSSTQKVFFFEWFQGFFVVDLSFPTNFARDFLANFSQRSLQDCNGSPKKTSWEFADLFQKHTWDSFLKNSTWYIPTRDSSHRFFRGFGRFHLFLKNMENQGTHSPDNQANVFLADFWKKKRPWYQGNPPD